MKISLAALEDIREILALYAACHKDNLSEEEKVNGFLTTSFTPEQLETLISRDKSVVIARDEENVIVGCVAVAPWEFAAQWGLFAYMMDHLEEYALDGQTITLENSCQYGPICVRTDCRGTGVFEALVRASAEAVADRWPMMVTFINQINTRSYAAHTRKGGWTEVGTFDFNNSHYYAMACPTGK